jgi:putative ABC transport system permease protein
MGGLAGATVGELIAFMGTRAISDFIGSDIPPEINIWVIAFTLLGTFIIGSVAGIIPAMQAARQNPVDALRD